MVLCKHYARGYCRFGTSCWYEHGTYSGGHQGSGLFGGQSAPAPAPAAGGALQSATELLSGIATEMKLWEQSKQWPFSCFSPLKGWPCIPGIEDYSPEELRHEAYKNKLASTPDVYLHQFNQLSEEYRQKRALLKSPNNQLTNYLQQQMGAVAGGGAVAGSSTSVFGGVSSSGMGSSTGSSVFGASSSANSVFGGSASTSSFGSGSALMNRFGSSGSSQPPAVQPGVFGGGSSLFDGASQQQSSGGSLFGGGGGMSSSSLFGGSAGQQTTSVFGSPPLQNSTPPVQGSMFGSQPAVPSGSIFGQTASASGSVFGGGHGNPQPAAQTHSVFGASPPVGQSFGGGVQQHPPPSFGPSTVATPSPGNPTATSSIFGAPNATAPGTGSTSTTTTTSLFDRQPGPSPGTSVADFLLDSAQSLFGKPTPGAPATQNTGGGLFGKGGGSVSGTDVSPDYLYSQISDLSEAELAAFRADQFTLGQVPRKLPPRELCVK